MKRIIVLYLLMMLMLSTFAQNVSILDSSLKWNIGTHCVNEGPMHPYDKWATTFLHIEGDTLMNDKHYKRLISCSDSLCRKQSLKTFIREEAGRVFFASKTEELLQFDFNSKKGDHIIMDFLNNPQRELRYFITIDSVKSITLKDNKERIVQYVTVFDYHKSKLGDYSLPDVLVEGIGSLKFGLQFPSDLFVTGDAWCDPNLLCIYSGKGIIYANSEINNCYLSTGVQQLLKQPELVQVFSNEQGMLELQLIEAKRGKLIVFDIHGKQILGQTINHSGLLFCLPSSGIYLYRFESEKGKVQSGKVLVK